MTAPPIVKRLYEGVALFALLNVLGLGGLVVLLIRQGTLDSEKLHRIVAVMRGEDVAPASDETPPTVEGAGADQPTKEAAPANAASPTDAQILRLEAERIKTELDQRLALNNSILLRVRAEHEQFQKERDEAERRFDQMLKERQQEGFRKQIAIYESLAPKIALEHLLASSDPDEAAGILLEMDTRKAKKIVETAKSGEKMEKMKDILQRIRRVHPKRFEDLQLQGG